MLFYKTNTKYRDTYKYYDADGKVCSELRAGVDGVTEKHILELHKDDDRSVYHNCKSHRPRFEDFQSHLIEDWKDDYINNFKDKYGYKPNEKDVQFMLDEAIPKNWNLSLDALIDSSDSSEGCGDKSEALLFAYESSQEADLPEIERLREIISAMPERWQEIYYLVHIEEIPMTTVAKQRGVSEAAIRKIIKKIKKQIEEDEYLKKILR